MTSQGGGIDFGHCHRKRWMAVVRAKGPGQLEELVLLEIQSVAKTEDGSDIAGKVFGDLLISQKEATISFGPRILKGKVVELKSPLVLAERPCEPNPQGSAQPGSTELVVRGVIHKKVVFSDRSQLKV